METLIYDGSFAGLLTAVFEIYEYGCRDPVVIPASSAAQVLFGQSRSVTTNEQKAGRVWKGLQRYISDAATMQIYRAFLSEEQKMESFLIQYIRYAFDTKFKIEFHFTHPAVQYVVDTAKKVHREKHRMEAFVRFQQTKDNLYFALITPDFNVLPLIQRHFETRYTDQRWVIYDARRKYGLSYDGDRTSTVEMEFREDLGEGNNICTVLDEKEELYKQLWQLYFDSVNIKARLNMKLHIQHVPLRYWKFLPEKRYKQLQTASF